MVKKSNRIKQSKMDGIIDCINYFLLSLLLVIFLWPLIFILSASISDPNAVWSGQVWLLPKDVSFEGYRSIIQYKPIWLGYRNSLLYLTIGTTINLFMTVTAAYPLSRRDFYPQKILMALYTFTMFFGGGLIPSYLLVKSLGLLNTMWVMVIPNAVAVWNIIITKTFFQTNIPSELLEAAALDGCSNMSFLTKIVLPLSTPIIAVMVLFYGVGHWNAFFGALIYLSDRNLYPLQLVLRDLLVQNQVGQEMGSASLDSIMQQRVAETMKYGIIIVASLPVLMLYPFVQKHFVKGIMVGSLKG